MVIIEGDRKFLEKPENISLEHMGIKYNLEFELINDQKIKVNRTYTPIKLNIMPDEYPAFRSFMLSVIEAEKSHLIIK